MDIYKSELFPFIQGAQLLDRNFDLTIKALVVEILPNHKGESEKKHVLYFEETTKGLILNKTNAQTIAELFGRETDEWSGKRINLYTEKVKAFGKTHDAVRVRAARSTKPAKNGATPTPEPETDRSPMDDVETVDKAAREAGRGLSGEEQYSLLEQAEDQETERYYTES